MIADPALMCHASAAIFLEALGPVIAAPGEHLDRLVREMDLHPVAVEFDFVDPAVAAGHLVDGSREGGLDETGEGRLNAYGCQSLTLGQTRKPP